MLLVLLMLCAYYSVRTYRQQQPEGPAAGEQLAGQISSSIRKPSSVLIVATKTELDARFADALEQRLRKAGYDVCGKTLGEPRDTRLAMDNLNKRGVDVAVIATTEQCAVWKVFESRAARFPHLANSQLLYPRAYNWPTFLKKSNLVNVANQMVVIAVIAVGMTLVIITGGIDLSVGSLVALCAVVVAMLIGKAGGDKATVSAVVLCGLAGIVACTLIGLVSGLLVTQLHLPPFIATLGMMQVARGIAYQLSNSNSFADIPSWFTWLGNGVGFFSIPHGVVLMLLVFVAAHILMSRTTFGRYIYAVGGNREAARLSGVRVRTVLLLVYVICGATAGLGGVILASQLKSGAPNYGANYELFAIAAVVVGGSSLSGGEGRVSGTLIGALIMGVIQNGMNLTGVGPYAQMIVTGVLLILAVSLDTFRRRRE